MRKTLWFVLLFLSLGAFTASVDAKTRTFNAKGEVVSADPLYGRVLIQHGAIKGFAGNEQTEFVVRSKELLNGLSKRDLVDFTIEENNGDAEIIQISKTGTAPPPDDRLPVGKMAQDILVATGEAAKTVTMPIDPAHQVVSGTVGAATDVTGTVLKDAKDKVKQEF